jgi:hypothetical protein
MITLSEFVAVVVSSATAEFFAGLAAEPAWLKAVHHHSELDQMAPVPTSFLLLQVSF